MVVFGDPGKMLSWNLSKAYICDAGRYLLALFLIEFIRLPVRTYIKIISSVLPVEQSATIITSKSKRFSLRNLKAFALDIFHGCTHDY